MPVTNTLSRQDAAHLLRRTGFGGTNAEITALTGMTRRAAIDAAMVESTARAPSGPRANVQSNEVTQVWLAVA